MLIVCPNCATSYGVEMASLRPAKGWTRKLRCHHCRWVWQAELSNTDKLLVAAEAVPPVWRAMAAIAQAAADAARSALPRLRRATAVLAEELDASRAPPDHAPSRPAGSHPEPAGPETARAPVTPLAERISAIVAGVVGAIRRQSWCLSWPLSWWRSWWRAWRVSWWRSSWRSWLLSWRQSWCCGARHCHTFSVNPGDKLPFSAVLEAICGAGLLLGTQ